MGFILNFLFQIVYIFIINKINAINNSIIYLKKIFFCNFFTVLFFIRKAKEAELKKIKQAHRKEIKKRLNAVKAIAGDASLAVTAEDLEADYDDQKFAERMESIFGRRYYDRSDAVEEQCKEERAEQKKVLAANFAKIEGQLNAARQVDFEALYGRIDSDEEKFAYVRVKPKSYGLSAADILAAEDKELTKRISIKFLAPFPLFRKKIY